MWQFELNHFVLLHTPKSTRLPACLEKKPILCLPDVDAPDIFQSDVLSPNRSSGNVSVGGLRLCRAACEPDSALIGATGAGKLEEINF